ncbi:hypothetical protein K439DRAFT_1399325 [Ramaria rubella]|nr:hypothetical protein K439DRAFT_1399325 [Ramaria rubella]
MGTLDSTLGAMEIGIFLSIFLYGIATAQVFFYIHSEYKDTLALKLLVSLIGRILETLHTFCICILLYNLTITNYGISSTIDNAFWSLDLSAVLSAWKCAFFAYRVKVISDSWFIPVVSWSLSLFRAAFGVVTGVTTMRAKTLTQYIQTDGWLITSQFTICAAIDVLNTVSLCYFLLRRKQIWSNRLIDKIVLWSIETESLTSVIVLAMLTCSITMPDNLIYIGILMPYAKLFSNSFLTSSVQFPLLIVYDVYPKFSLNARRGLRPNHRG